MILSERMNKNRCLKEIGNYVIKEKYDVIVAGLGTAGAIALMAAAGKGLKVLGIERLHCMGGMGTAGGVMGYYFGSNGGLYEEVDAAAADRMKKGYLPMGQTQAILKEYLMEQEALKRGAEVLYESVITGVFLEDNKVRGIQWTGPDGIREAEGKIVIDCTGDAEVCALAGCKTRAGRSADSQVQPYSSVKVFLEEHKVRYRYDDNGYVDPTHALQMSEAIIESGSIHLKDAYDDRERLLYIAPLLGIREGRFIEGEENVTLEKYFQDQVTDQPLFYAYSNIDNHSKDIAFESEVQQDWSVVGSLWGINFSVPVPMGALIPKGVEGILVAGRCIAVDHDIASCVRMERDMQKCGEAAAIVAYLSIKNGIPVTEVLYDELKPLLLETSCLDQENYMGRKVIVSNNKELSQKFDWMTEPSVIKEALKSEQPGIGIWSAKRLGESIVNDLKEWMKEDGCDNLRKHSAFALGLMKNPACLPLLRNMAVERDGFVPKTSRKYNQVRGYTAVYLLGKLRDVESLPILFCIIEEASKTGKVLLQEDIAKENTEFIASAGELSFQYFSHALSALMKIGDQFEEKRSLIRDRIFSVVFNQDFTHSVKLKGPNFLEYSMTDRIRNIVKGKLNEWKI